MKVKEKVMEIVFLVAACVSILAVLLICVFLFSSGIPAIGKIGPLNFLGGTVWKPSNNLFGILPMILGSIYVTAGAIIIGVPIGIFMAVFMARFCPGSLYKIFFGMEVLVPLLRNTFAAFNCKGNSMLAASILLGIMILPTIIGVSESAIRAVPNSYYEGSLALGADHERSVFFAVLPAAKSGILAGVVLGIGRAIGETMAVIMVAGNQPAMAHSIFKGVRTMTANVVIEMGYATGIHREALIATGVVLFVFILLINLLFSVIKRREK